MNDIQLRQIKVLREIITHLNDLLIFIPAEIAEVLKNQI